MADIKFPVVMTKGDAKRIADTQESYNNLKFEGYFPEVKKAPAATPKAEDKK